MCSGCRRAGVRRLLATVRHGKRVVKPAGMATLRPDYFENMSSIGEQRAPSTWMKNDTVFPSLRRGRAGQGPLGARCRRRGLRGFTRRPWSSSAGARGVSSRRSVRDEGTLGGAGTTQRAAALAARHARASPAAAASRGGKTSFICWVAHVGRNKQAGRAKLRNGICPLRHVWRDSGAPESRVLLRAGHLHRRRPVHGLRDGPHAPAVLGELWLGGARHGALVSTLDS